MKTDCLPAAARYNAPCARDLSDLELIHYSSKPLVLEPKHPAARRDVYFKPIGLWVSVKGPMDWVEWCESESFGSKEDFLKCETRITLAEKANVLCLRGAGEIDAFTSEFLLEPPRYSGDRSIDWPLVARRYDGIVITPYCWERRMTSHTFWYYGWDCASGCIWNRSAIESLAQAGGTHAPQGKEK